MDSRISLFLTAAFLILGEASAQSDYQTIGLSYHNSYRQIHNAPLMSLDSYLNTAAQECATYYASRKTIDHSCTTSGAGENLYLEWGTSDDHTQAVETAIKAWYDENVSYNYGDPSGSISVAAHFTQLVWKQSTSLGIGAATVEGYTVVVGKYSPFGNIVDSEFQYYRTNVE